MIRSPELLAPAGNVRKMRTAWDFGADAVYAGLPKYSLRARNNEFTLDDIALAVAEAAERQRKFFLTVNLFSHNPKTKTFERDMERVLERAVPHALIMADPGLIMIVRQKWPHIPVHLSVQANTVNYQAVKFWQSVGVRRVILSRELSLDEIKEIRERCPDMELEVFVHGAICIAYSGRCLLSGYFNHRDANQGVCTNSCRWNYNVIPAAETGTGDVVPAALHTDSHSSYLLEESTRPGQFMPIYEDEDGTHIMNSKDLRAVEHVDALVRLGIDSLKIEGRTKSPYYVARTTQTYRRAIDDAVAGRPFNAGLLKDLDALASRGYTQGFFEPRGHADHQNYETGVTTIPDARYVGDALSYDRETKRAKIAVRNRFVTGDLLEFVMPHGNNVIKAGVIYDLSGNPLAAAKGDGHVVLVDVPFECQGALITATAVM
ncbi:MAG: tRNA 5-hydroxyuridine modification protein YegQ [Spirochaetia bacterium]|nr:tRNA 5-hydroxyuridine modification protein YegQ [Spirochaetia bacterium]